MKKFFAKRCFIKFFDENFMKNTLVSLILFFICTGKIEAQEDTSFTNRLNAALIYTEKADYDRVFDYTYPKLFTLITREQMKEAIKSSFDSEEFSISLDSLKILKVYPVFIINGESFTKVIHTMRMMMKFKEPLDTINTEALNERYEMSKYMEAGFPGAIIRYDRPTDAVIISTTADMIAIKIKEDNKWYFANYDEENPRMLTLLFDNAVLEKLKTYK